MKFLTRLQIVQPLSRFTETILQDAIILSNCTNASCINILKRLDAYAVKTTVEVGTEISKTSSEALTIVLRMDEFAVDLRTFGADLRHKWGPAFVEHRDTKVPTSFKLFGGGVLVGASLLAAGPLTVSAAIAYLVPTAAIGTLGTYAVGYYEEKWADEGTKVLFIPNYWLYVMFTFNLDIFFGGDCRYVL